MNNSNTEEPMSLSEFAGALVALYSAALTIGGADLARLDLMLKHIEELAAEVEPLKLATTTPHLDHLARLLELCRPIQEEMARAPHSRRNYGSFVA